MFRLLDNLLNKIRDHRLGYNSGYVDGLEAGISATRAGIERKLSDKNPRMNSAEFQLGYEHALAVVKGEI